MAAASHPWQLSLAWSLFPRTSRGRRRRKHPFASRLLFMVPDVSSAYRLMGLISQSRSKLTHQSMSPALPLSHLALAGTRSLSRIFFFLLSGSLQVLLIHPQNSCWRLTFFSQCLRDKETGWTKVLHSLRQEGDQEPNGHAEPSRGTAISAAIHQSGVYRVAMKEATPE